MDNRPEPDGIAYDEWLRTLDQVIPDRPPCPECGSKNIHANGLSWVCRDCGRNYLKVIRGTKKYADGKDIKCPRCGGDDVILNGCGRLKCKDCRKTWNKE